MTLQQLSLFWSVVTLLVIFALAYWLLWLPVPPVKPVIRPGIASLHGDESEPAKRLKHLYPETLYEGGDYAELPLGRIKYWILGYEWCPKLILISGIAAPSVIWKEIVPALLPHFRLLIYDHYGRGYSDAPDTTYDTMFYLTELALLMQHVKFEKAHLLGLSMGGGIAVAFAANFPSLVEGKVALIAPVGLLSPEHLPHISKLVANRAANWFLTAPLTRRVLLDRYSRDESEGTLDEIINLQRLLLPGFLKALGSTVRDGPLRGLQESYAIVGQSKLDIFVIWGTHDESVPYSLATELLRRIPSAKLVTIPEGDHDLTVSRGEATSKLLVDFLKE